MKKKNIILFIIIALVLIGFTIYSIVKNDLTIVQEMFGMQSKTAISDEIVQDEPKKELQELVEVAPTELPTDTSNNKIQNNINIINNTNTAISEAKKTDDNLSNNINSNTTTNSFSNVNSSNIVKENISNTYKTNSVGSTNTLNNKNFNNTTNNVSNNIDKSIVNKNKLPAAGVKTAIIWVVAILAIISIISNIKYRNIPLK